MKCFSAALVDVKLHFTGLKMKIRSFLPPPDVSAPLGFPAEQQFSLQLRYLCHLKFQRLNCDGFIKQGKWL